VDAEIKAGTLRVSRLGGRRKEIDARVKRAMAAYDQWAKTNPPPSNTGAMDQQPGGRQDPPPGGGGGGIAAH
jgi:hypothetical protein